MKQLFYLMVLTIGMVLLAGSMADQKTVAVLYFDNNSGEEKYTHLGKGMASMIISDLSSISSIKLVERERLQDLLEELELQQSHYFDSTTALHIGKMIGAEYVVTGALTAIDPSLRIDARVIRVETNEIVKTAEATGPEDRFFKVHEQLVDELVDGLEIALSPEETEHLRAQQEANRITELETAVAYSEALDRFDREDYAGALERMQVVVAAEPNSAIANMTYNEIKKRTIASGKEKAKEKANRALRKIFK